VPLCLYYFDLWLLLPAAGGTKAGEIAPVVVHMRPMDEDGACVRSHNSISTLCTNQPEIARIFDHTNIDVSSASIGAVDNQSEMSCPEYVWHKLDAIFGMHQNCGQPTRNVLQKI
jgi:hypothetical protein